MLFFNTTFIRPFFDIDLLFFPVFLSTMIIFLSVDFTEHQNAYFAFGADWRSEKKRIFVILPCVRESIESHGI
jgi:hypothetical protein